MQPRGPRGRQVCRSDVSMRAWRAGLAQSLPGCLCAAGRGSRPTQPGRPARLAAPARRSSRLQRRSTRDKGLDGHGRLCTIPLPHKTPPNGPQLQSQRNCRCVHLSCPFGWRQCARCPASQRQGQRTVSMRGMAPVLLCTAARRYMQGTAHAHLPCSPEAGHAGGGYLRAPNRRELHGRAGRAAARCRRSLPSRTCDILKDPSYALSRCIWVVGWVHGQ
jgi:hypothetical protein